MLQGSLVAVVAVGAGGGRSGARRRRGGEARRDDDGALRRRAAAAGPRDSSARSTRCSRKMTLDEKLKQLTLLSDGQINDDPRQAPSRSARVFSLTDPAMINHYQHDRRRAVAAAHPDPVRLRHDPRLPDDLPDPARRRRAASTRTSRGPTTASAPFESAAVGLKQIYSPMVDVSHEPRWGRISEAAGEDPYLELGDGRRARARAPRATTTARRTRSSRASSTSSPTASPRRAATTTRPTCRAAAVEPLPAAVQGRGRRRRGHRDVLVQRDQRRARAARTRTPRPTSSSGAGASTASSRATTRRSPSCAPARA